MTRSRILSWLAVAAVFAGALGVRLVKFSEPPLDFHPTRQYRSALLARRYFLEGRVDVPEWRTQLARANAEEVYEPPLMERAAAFGYRLLGREDLRIPRALSIASWLVAGAFVYALASRLAGPHGALVAASFFLFAPFGVEASRSFQPDPAMVMWIAASALALLRYGERPQLSTLALAGVCGALAVLTKPMALFPVVGAFAGVTWARRGELGRRAPVHVIAFLAMLLLPALPWYLPRLAAGGSAAAVARISFHPGLLLTAPFWIGWIGQVWKTSGLVALVAAAIGATLVRPPVARALLAGLAAGYAAFVIAFTYQASTHDYYHLLLMPLVAAGLAPLAQRGLDLVREASNRPRAVLAIASAVLFAACADAALTSRSRLRTRHFDGQVRMFREVGVSVGHAPSNVLLADDYAYPLKYYGELGGSNWPRAYDLPLMRLLGEPQPDAAARLQTLLDTQRPRFFVVTVPQDLASQPDLAALLERTYARHAAGEGYIVYVLARGPGAAAQQPPGLR